MHGFFWSSCVCVHVSNIQIGGFCREPKFEKMQFREAVPHCLSQMQRPKSTIFKLFFSNKEVRSE